MHVAVATEDERLMFQIGDVIEPREGQTPLVHGAYEVVRIGENTATLSRLIVTEESETKRRLNCTTIIPVAMLKMFDIVPLD